jgi:hypothetical protein
MKKFWLYFGIFLACTGIGTIAGIIMIILYFMEDIKEFISTENSKYSDCNDEKPDLTNESYIDPQFYDDDTAERLR